MKKMMISVLGAGLAALFLAGCSGNGNTQTAGSAETGEPEKPASTGAGTYIVSNMEDLLAIESKLSEVRYELENYGSQLRMLDNQIDYSTVNVDVDEVERITETGEKSFFAEIKDRFGDSLYQVGRGIRSFVIGFLGFLPIIFVWVVIAAVVVIVVRSIRKKRKKKKE